MQFHLQVAELMQLKALLCGLNKDYDN